MLDAVGQTNAAAWMDHFRLTSVQTDQRPGLAVLAPTLTFAGGVHNVATGPRVKRVADTLTQILAHPMRVEVADGPPRRGPSPSDDPGDHLDATPPGRTSSAGLDRRDALSLPLVRDVFEVFPDATLIGARKETLPAVPADSTPPPSDSASADPQG